VTSAQTLPVILLGAAGKMGLEAVRALVQAPGKQILAALTRTQGLGQDLGVLAGLAPLGVTLCAELEPVLAAAPPSAVVLDLTQGEAAFRHACQALDYHLPVVIGATGLSEAQIEALSQRAQAQQTGVLLAPNFSLGALLMMRFAQQAAHYFDWTEIIEFHHPHKLDAPSGTARKTARLMAEANPNLQAAAIDQPARGQLVDGIPVHAVRLPGLLAHQEVILGGQGQTLTLRHDSLDRSSFMPGMLLALERVRDLDHFVYGLEHLI